jgi:hypothetical protein
LVQVDGENDLRRLAGCDGRALPGERVDLQHRKGPTNSAVVAANQLPIFLQWKRGSL